MIPGEKELFHSCRSKILRKGRPSEQRSTESSLRRWGATAKPDFMPPLSSRRANEAEPQGYKSPGSRAGAVGKPWLPERVVSGSLWALFGLSLGSPWALV